MYKKKKKKKKKSDVGCTLTKLCSVTVLSFQCDPSTASYLVTECYETNIKKMEKRGNRAG